MCSVSSYRGPITSFKLRTNGFVSASNWRWHDITVGWWDVLGILWDIYSHTRPENTQSLKRLQPTNKRLQVKTHGPNRVGSIQLITHNNIYSVYFYLSGVGPVHSVRNTHFFYLEVKMAKGLLLLFQTSAVKPENTARRWNSADFLFNRLVSAPFCSFPQLSGAENNSLLSVFRGLETFLSSSSASTGSVNNKVTLTLTGVLLLPQSLTVRAWQEGLK